jgi:predicted nucleic acid-binding Zn ribbon protein
MKPINSVLESVLRSCNLWQGYQQYQLVLSWPEIVGSPLSDVTRAEQINNGVMKISVKDSVWSYHLTMMKPQLIDKLNRYAGSKIVKDLYFKIDNLENNT